MKKHSAPEVLELREAWERSGLTHAAVATACGVRPWVVASALTGVHSMSLEYLNKVRSFFKLAPLWVKPGVPPTKPSAPRRKPSKQAARVQVPESTSAPAIEDDTLPACNWHDVAAAALELSTAAADYQFIQERFQEATFRLRAAKRRALAAGIAIAPTLIGGGGKSLQASKHTTQFFKLLSVGGALP